jgi:hypothetical protein
MRTGTPSVHHAPQPSLITRLRNMKLRQCPLCKSWPEVRSGPIPLSHLPVRTAFRRDVKYAMLLTCGSDTCRPATLYLLDGWHNVLTDPKLLVDSRNKFAMTDQQAFNYLLEKGITVTTGTPVIPMPAWSRPEHVLVNLLQPIQKLFLSLHLLTGRY